MSAYRNFADIAFESTASAVSGGGESWLTPEASGKGGYSEADSKAATFLETWPGSRRICAAPIRPCTSTSPGPSAMRLLDGEDSKRSTGATSRPGQKAVGGVRSRHPSRL